MAGQGFDHAERFIQSLKPSRVVIVADLDDAKPQTNGDVTFPGIEGALKLSERLMPVVPDLRFLLPPDGFKDIRQWIGNSNKTPAGDSAVKGFVTAIADAPAVHPAWINRAWESVARRKAEYRQPSWVRQASALLATIVDDDERADLRFQFEERIAICIEDGNLPVDEAERIAFEQINQAIKIKTEGIV